MGKAPAKRSQQKASSKAKTPHANSTPYKDKKTNKSTSPSKADFFNGTNWKATSFWTEPSRIPTYISLFVISIFSYMFWHLNFSNHPNEPMYLTALYRLYDYGYFPAIQRYFEALGGEFFLKEKFGEGSLAMPFWGILPYGSLQFLIGPWTYPVGDVLVNCLRFAAFWILLKPIARERRERAWMSLLLFFASSEFVLGNFQQQWMFKGVWGIRIPRDIVTSTFFILSFAALYRLRSVLEEETIPWKKLIVLALPLTLLINGDVYSAIAVSFTYAYFILLWTSRGELNIKSILSYIGIGISLNLPMFLLSSQVPQFLFERLGRYPILNDLAVTKLASKEQILFFAASLLAVVLIRLYQGKRPANELLTYFVAALGFSFISSIVFSALAGFNIQEYQYEYRRGQFSGLLLIGWGLYLFQEVTNKLTTKQTVRRTALIVFVAAFGWVNFNGFYQYTQKYAHATTAPEFSKEKGYAGGGHPAWRRSAAEVVSYFQNKVKKDVVVAGWDHQLLWSLILMDNIYLFMPDPQQTIVQDREIYERFLYFSAIMGLSPNELSRIATSHEANLRILSGGKFQFNRLHSYQSLDSYPREALKTYTMRDNNWFLLTPASFVRKLTERYSLVQKSLSSGNPKYPLPDYIVWNELSGIKSNRIQSGYTEVFSNNIFSIYKKQN